MWKKFAGFWSFRPSWQNSVKSIMSVANEFVYSIVKIEDNIVGYGVLDIKTGDIPQIAVHTKHREKGIGRSIITDLIKNTSWSKVYMLNLECECKEMKEFLINLGFQHYVDQYEMILEL